jgi:hypothetical protein
MDGRHGSAPTVGKEHWHAVRDGDGDRPRGVGRHQRIGRPPGSKLMASANVDHVAAVHLPDTDDAGSLNVEESGEGSEAVGVGGRTRAEIARRERVTRMHGQGFRRENSTRRSLYPDEAFGNFRCRHLAVSGGHVNWSGHPRRRFSNSRYGTCNKLPILQAVGSTQGLGSGAARALLTPSAPATGARRQTT